MCRLVAKTSRPTSKVIKGGALIAFPDMVSAGASAFSRLDTDAATHCRNAARSRVTGEKVSTSCLSLGERRFNANVCTQCCGPWSDTSPELLRRQVAQL